MKEFKCRASAAGFLMTNPRSKSESMSETTKTYLQEWLKEQIFGMRKEIDTKQIRKGIEYEDMAIDKAIEWLDLPFAVKNSEQYSDVHFTGEPDLLLSDTVCDIKNSYDLWSFPMFDDEIPTKGYYYQLQVYMHLTGKRKARLIYVLLNTPETPWAMEISYDHVDPKYRIKEFCFDYDPQVIEELTKRVISAREYINTIKF